AFASVSVSLLVVGVLPLIVLVGVVIPFAGLLSLYKSWQTAKRAGIVAARVTTFWMLISQLAGGALTILVIPLLDLLLPPGWWTTAAAALLFAFALLMPIAFAIGVWTYRVLEIPMDGEPASP
ncbi:MAG: hypothetical protein ACRD1V_17000, partial [Vicinamibacterales bacterium]